jgi:hypothetical protein
MLFNEFPKAHRKVKQQEATIARQGHKIQEQEELGMQREKGMKTAVAHLEEQGRKSKS